MVLCRHECFTGKYITRKIRTKLHSGLEWRIFISSLVKISMISLISSLSLKVAENSYLLFRDFQNYVWNFPDVELYHFELLRNFFQGNSFIVPFIVPFIEFKCTVLLHSDKLDPLVTISCIYLTTKPVIPYFFFSYKYFFITRRGRNRGNLKNMWSRFFLNQKDCKNSTPQLILQFRRYIPLLLLNIFPQ